MKYNELIKFHKGLAHKLKKGKGLPARVFQKGEMRTMDVRESEMGPRPSIKEAMRDMTGGMVKRPLRYRL